MSVDWIFLAMFLAMVAVMVSASVSDWKRREVSDEHWMILGSVGIVGFTVFCSVEDGIRWEYVLMAIASFMMLADMFLDSNKLLVPFYASMIILFILPLYSLYETSNVYLAGWASIPISYAIFLGLYIFGIIQGGADTKCLVCLAMLFPVYPVIFSLPLISVPDNALSSTFTFAISSLFLGTFVVVLSCAYYVISNVLRGDRGKWMAIGYMTSVKEARTSHVWPMHDVQDGELFRCDISDDPNEIYDRLESSGQSRIWVTPMVPFIIPLTAVTVFMVLIGNPLFLISV